jgi:hypothetical protein
MELKLKGFKKTVPQLATVDNTELPGSRRAALPGYFINSYKQITI